MATIKHKNDKKLFQLKKESKKLHAEVEALEDALILHQRYKHDNDTSVRGLLRKEIGGSIWQRGGSGKLHSYRTANDLEESEKNVPESREFLSITKMGIVLMMKDNKGKHGNQKDHVTKTTNGLNVDSNFEIEAEKVSILKNKVLEKASVGVIHRKHSTPKTHSDLKSNVDSNKNSSKISNETPVKLQSALKNVDKSRHNKFDDVQNMRNITNQNAEKLLNDGLLRGKPPSTKLKQTNIKPSQALERCRDNEVFKILSMPSNQRPDQLPSNQRSDLVPKSCSLDNVVPSQNESNNSNREQTISKCDPHVKDWIQSLGLMEEEKYLKMFAENEMDMDEVSQLTALQLNEIGITAFGALNKILRGIKELKQTKNSLEVRPTKNLSSSLDFKNVLNIENENRQSKTLGHTDHDFKRSMTFEERLSNMDQSRTNLRRSRSFASSASKSLYSSDALRASLDDGMAERMKKEKANLKDKNIESNTMSVVRKSVNSPVQNTETPKIADKDNQPVQNDEKVKTLRKRSNSPARRPASSPARRKTKPADKPADSDVPAKKKCDNTPTGQKGPFSRQGSEAEIEEDDIDDGRVDKLDREYEQERMVITELDQDISKLISVTVLDPVNKNNGIYQDYEETPKREERSVERPRPRSSRHVRQSINKPIYIGADFPGKRYQSARENEVKTIESQIEELQNKALSGEMVTMDLVKGLQQRLEEIEQQIKDTKPPKIKPKHRGTELKYPVSMSVRGKDIISEIEKEKDIRPTRSPELLKVNDPLKSLEINSDDIMFDATDLVGEGTFSRVYHGVCLGAEVAIKQLKIPLTTHDKNYFAAEVSLLKELHHPRVVQLIGVCTTDKFPLMVLEFMARGSLYYYLHDPKCESMDHAEYYGVAHDIALGMNYLHHHKPQVLHLDLKSMNVLLDSSGRAKIADFGFSKFRHDADLKASKLSKKKSMCSSPTWMAPELLETGEITTKADVYSFGIILWEMLTRSHPYDGCSVFQILERVRLNKRPEISTNSPPDLSSLIKRCWDQNPAKRPAFKDIILQLDKLAFPPDWRALFKEAGVPNEALEDVQSARTIISLVNNTVDLENVKTMMEDIRHSNDAIMASHDLTRESHVYINQSNDQNRYPSNSARESYNFSVQSREPQKSLTTTTRRSQDMISSSNRHSYDKARNSGESILTRKSFDSPFSSTRNKKFDDEKNVGDSIEEEIGETEDVRDSFDFKFNTNFMEDFQNEQNQDEKFFQKSQTSLRDFKNSAHGEDTTAEYLNYLKTSCEILSPTIRSPVRSKYSDNMKDFLYTDSEKSDQTGAVIETIASIPRSKSPLADLRKSDQRFDHEVLNSTKSSSDKNQSTGKSHDSIVGKSHDSTVRKSHDILLQEIRKSKSNLEKETPQRFMAKQENEEKDLKSTTGISHDSTGGKSHDMENQQSDVTDSSMRKSHDAALKEMLNSKAYSKTDPSSKRSHDHLKKESTPRKSHDESSLLRKSHDSLIEDSSPRLSHDKWKKDSTPRSLHASMMEEMSLRKSHDVLKKDSTPRKSHDSIIDESPLRKSHDVLKKDSTPGKSHDSIIDESPLRKSHDVLKKDSTPRKSHDSIIDESPLRKSHDVLKKDFTPRKSHDSIIDESPLRKSHDVLKKDISPRKSHDSIIYESFIKKSNDDMKKDSTPRKTIHANVMDEIRNSGKLFKKDGKKNPVSAYVDSKDANSQKSAKVRANESSEDENFIPKNRDAEQKFLDLLQTDFDSGKINTVDTKEKVQTEIEVKSKLSSKDKSNGKKKGPQQNLLTEMKSLHTKLRSEKTGHVEEIKQLHTKLRSGKKGNENMEKNSANGNEMKDNILEKDDTSDKDSIENIDIKDDLDNLSVDSLDLNDSITEDIGHMTNSRRLKSKTEKVDKKEDINNSAKSLPENSNTGKNNSVKNLPDLRMSLNNEIAQFSTKKLKRKEKGKTEQTKEDDKEKGKKNAKESVKSKPKKKAKSVPDKKTAANENLTASNENCSENQTNPKNRKSIEAWVEAKPVMTDAKQKQRKISTSSLPSHPPPILLPEDPPPNFISDDPPIPPAPPIPTMELTPPPAPPIPSMELTPPPAPPLPEQDAAVGETTNSKIKKRLGIPEAKHSSHEATPSNSTKSNLAAKGDDSEPVMVKSAELRDQKEVLQSISKPHPNQLTDLSQVNKQTYTSIADILKRANWTDIRMAVFSRREAMGEDNYSPSPSVASSWSFVDD
ncbi:Probable serine/threonine-protein kinase DDB_G0267514,Probable serine/threonine-protein kinase drkC [Mytilus edulis]|uniref:Probable serine/threonine-protein kinase DDB_G0267514,Probable serine/threonine-protein kinase drkC n=1 Tax=Mytilus edulis TaxID=6550 RepID=A0A8S3Q528_MYTED|nr:Probable serine/threonine-protein kinase DDB_G0267514,Probable serine/threonine-protein kinase drkC [Mytilus edulis]